MPDIAPREDAIFEAMRAREQAALIEYDADFLADKYIPATITKVPYTMRFPLRGTFETRRTAGGREEDVDIIIVFLGIGKRSGNSLQVLSREAAKWKNRLHDAYAANSRLGGVVNHARVLNWEFAIHPVAGETWFGLDHQVEVGYWRTVPQG